MTPENSIPLIHDNGESAKTLLHTLCSVPLCSRRRCGFPLMCLARRRLEAGPGLAMAPFPEHGPVLHLHKCYMVPAMETCWLALSQKQVHGNIVRQRRKINF